MREYTHLTGFFKILRDWWFYFVLIDMIAMAMLYKNYWGRSIFEEFFERKSDWKYDEKNKKYVESDNKMIKDTLRDKANKVIKMEQNLDDIVTHCKTSLNESICDLKEVKEQYASDIDVLDKNIKTLDDKVEEINSALLYHPDGELAKEFANDFKTYSQTT